MDNVKLDQTADVDKSSTFNLEAEQALIGLLLVNSDVLGEIESIIDEDHFYDGINKKIFTHIASRTKKGLIVSPITLKPYLDSDEDFHDIDVPSLLTELSAMAISAYAAKDYANALYDLAVRRKLVDIGNEIILDAKKITDETVPAQLITKAEQSLYNVSCSRPLGSTFWNETSAHRNFVRPVHCAWLGFSQLRLLSRRAFYVGRNSRRNNVGPRRRRASVYL